MQYADRVQETTTTTGTGTLSLGGAVTGYRTFASAFSASDTVRYAIVGGAEWEVGEGVYSSSTLTRVTVFASSNSNALVSFSAGTKNVWSNIPAAALSSLGTAASNSVLYRNSSGNVGASTVMSLDDSSTNETILVACENQSTVFRIKAYAASVNGGNFVTQKARGTIASPTKALSGDQLGGLASRGYYEDAGGGFGPSNTNAVRFLAEEDFTSTTNGSAVAFFVCKKATTSVSEVFRVNGHGYLTLSCQTASTGSVPIMRLTGAAHTAQTASTELNDVLIDGSATLQFATGALTTQRQMLVKARTYSAVAASTITSAATVAIDKAPVAGTNATITNSYALWVQAGLSKLDGGLTSTYAGLGTTPAGAGYIRLPYAAGAQTFAAMRNDTNGGDWNILNATAAYVTLGDAALQTQVTLYGTSILFGDGAGVEMQVAGNYLFRWEAAAIRSAQPLIGDTRASSPYGVHGLGTQAMADANQTPAAAVYVFGTVQTTGALTADRNLTLPTATDAAAYTKWIDNLCTGNYNVVVKCASGATVSVPNGQRICVLVDSRGVTAFTTPTGDSQLGLMMAARTLSIRS